MNNPITFILAFTLLVSSTSGFWFHPYAATDKCEKIGLSCSQDCKHVNYCPTVNSDAVVIRDCPDASFCSTKTGEPECDATSCSTAKPICSVSGAIPSPSDCHIFYICAKPGDEEPTEVNCGDNVFNPLKNQCDSTAVCYEPVDCAKAGNIGKVDPTTGVFCYYCSDINTPFIYPCTS